MTQTDVPVPQVATQDEWLAHRLALLDHEKALTKRYDQVNAERRRLPMVKLKKAYSFEGPLGKCSLADLFEGQKQLIVYHFMFDPEWENGCMGCTGFIDALGDLSMLGERNTRFVVISRAPLEKLDAYKASKGWTIPWLSSFGSDFNYDFNVTNDTAVAPPVYNYRSEEEWKHIRGNDYALTGEQPGLSVFFRVGDDVFHTYSTYGRGTDNVTDTYALLDITPYGRQEDFEESPPGWPQKPTYG